jgi:hypothetical protein
MVQFGHEKTSQSPMPRALSWKEPAEHRIVMEGAGEHLSGFRGISTPGHPYLKTSHAHQRRPLPDSTARLRNEGPPGLRLRARLRDFLSDLRWLIATRGMNRSSTMARIRSGGIGW